MEAIRQRIERVRSLRDPLFRSAVYMEDGCGLDNIRIIQHPRPHLSGEIGFVVFECVPKP
jgi:hypothetical protein